MTGWHFWSSRRSPTTRIFRYMTLETIAGLAADETNGEAPLLAAQAA